MSGKVNYRDELGSIRDSLDCIARQVGDCAMASDRIATALEIIAADVLEQQAARRAEVRAEFRYSRERLDSPHLTGPQYRTQRENHQSVVDRLLAAHPWLKDEVSE